MHGKTEFLHIDTYTVHCTPAVAFAEFVHANLYLMIATSTDDCLRLWNLI